MKTIKRYLALVVIVNTMVISACGGTGSDQQTLEQRSEEATTADAQTVEEATETPAETTEASADTNEDSSSNDTSPSDQTSGETETVDSDETEASEPNVAESSSVDEILDAACGMYVEKQGDTIELVKTDEGYRFETITLKTRDEHYNDGTDLSTEFGVNGDVEEFDGMNVTVTFQTQLAADEGTAVINKDGFIELSLKSPYMPDYSGSFILQ